MPNLFSCQISSSELALIPASAGLGYCQPNVRRQATFLNRGYGFGCRIDAQHQVGGADRDRTGGLLVANQALSQLSYSPTIMVGLGRLELPTSSLSGMRSSHLSYRPGVSAPYSRPCHLERERGSCSCTGKTNRRFLAPLGMTMDKIFRGQG